MKHSLQDTSERLWRAARRWPRPNAQELAALQSKLSRMAPGECFVVLAEAFTSELPEAGAAQEYAGRLLLQLKPTPPYGVKETTRRLLSKWDVSVEQLPWYLEAVFGADTLAGALLELESTTEVSRRVIETVRFWLRVPVEQRA